MYMEKNNLNCTYKKNRLYAYSGVVSCSFCYISSKLSGSEKSESNVRNNNENNKMKNIAMLSWKSMMHWCLEYCMQSDYNSVILWKNWEKSREK